LSKKRDAIVQALQRAGIAKPTEDDIDTAANQLDAILPEPPSPKQAGFMVRAMKKLGAVLGMTDEEAVVRLVANDEAPSDADCDEAVRLGEECKRKYIENAPKREAARLERLKRQKGKGGGK
jgi:hypothetical protein